MSDSIYRRLQRHIEARTLGLRAMSETARRAVYSVVKLTGIRAALERLLEARRPEAVLSEKREGFDSK